MGKDSIQELILIHIIILKYITFITICSARCFEFTIFFAVASEVLSTTIASVNTHAEINDNFNGAGTFFMVLRATKSAAFIVDTFAFVPGREWYKQM